MKKRILSFILSLCMIGGLGISLPMAVSAEVSFSGGSGTESKPYLISNYGDLKELAEYVNSGNSTSGKYFMLTNSINC